MSRQRTVAVEFTEEQKAGAFYKIDDSRRRRRKLSLEEAELSAEAMFDRIKNYLDKRCG